MQTLYDYIERKREHSGQDGPVFIALRSPYNAVDFSTVTRILVEAIVLAGLSTNEFSVKSFRTTVAMTAIVQTWIPRLSEKWADGKKQEVSYYHLVKDPLNTLNLSFAQNIFSFVPSLSQ